ncbi:MAG TPA: hypothetical protein ENJ54_04300 [Chloroflexi bacterium]|nr:hypothetical protein [Chloroflexota bacterium]
MALIDPVEVIVAYLTGGVLGAAAEGRVATRHHYGDAWPVGASGVVVTLDRQWRDAPGVGRCRVNVRLYAPTDAEVSNLALLLAQMERRERFTVSTTAGEALVYNFLPDIGLWPAYDEVLKMPLGVYPVAMMYAEEALP